MLPVSLDCQFVIAPSVFTNVYLHTSNQVPIFCICFLAFVIFCFPFYDVCLSKSLLCRTMQLINPNYRTVSETKSWYWFWLAWLYNVVSDIMLCYTIIVCMISNICQIKVYFDLEMKANMIKYIKSKISSNLGQLDCYGARALYFLDVYPTENQINASYHQSL